MGAREFPMTADPSTRVIQLEMASPNYVPQGVGEQSQDLPFAALVLDAKAVAQITGSFSLTWPALVQRDLSSTNARFPASHLCKFGYDGAAQSSIINIVHSVLSGTTSLHCPCLVSGYSSFGKPY